MQLTTRKLGRFRLSPDTSSSCLASSLANFPPSSFSPAPDCIVQLAKHIKFLDCLSARGRLVTDFRHLISSSMPFIGEHFVLVGIREEIFPHNPSRT